MGQAARKPVRNGPATYADIEALPPHITGEIIDGQLHTQPRPSARHAAAEAGVQTDLGAAFGRRRGNSGPGGWVILPEPELHLGDHVLVSDLAGWKRDRMSEVPDTAYIDMAPDWVCEIVSPSTVRKDRIVKLPKYAEQAVPWLWLVDPVERTVEAFQRQADGRWLLLGTFGGNATAAIPPFDAVAFDLREWWGGPEQPDDDDSLP
jgi:Uma2 family endonuclease